MTHFIYVTYSIIRFFGHLDFNCKSDNFVNVVNQVLKSSRLKGKVSCKISSVDTCSEAFNFSSSIGLGVKKVSFMEFADIFHFLVGEDDLSSVGFCHE